MSLDPSNVVYVALDVLLALVLLAGAVIAGTRRRRLGAAATTLLVLGTTLGALRLGFGVWWTVAGLRSAITHLQEAGRSNVDILDGVRWVTDATKGVDLVWVTLLLAGALIGRARPDALDAYGQVPDEAVPARVG